MYPNWNGKEKIMFPSNPSFVEKLVQTKQEEIDRQIRGFDERDFLNFQKPIIKIALKPKEDEVFFWWKAWQMKFDLLTKAER